MHWYGLLVCYWVGESSFFWEGKWGREIPDDDLKVFLEMASGRGSPRRYVPCGRADGSKVDGLKSGGKRNERESKKRLKEVESHPKQLSG